MKILPLLTAGLLAGFAVFAQDTTYWKHDLKTGLNLNQATFSEITFSFRFGPRVLLQGMGLAIVMGLVGGLFPAIRAIRLEITDALRQR